MAVFLARSSRRVAVHDYRFILVRIHGVMNTDNVLVSGETVDYGPCAFMDSFHPETVFSSIDTGGRYAYQMQPAVAQWNMARFAEALLPLIADDQDQAVEQATALRNSRVKSTACCAIQPSNSSTSC